MARAHFVQKARKDNPAAKKGESYWWWKFRYGGKRYSKTRPKPSQLTQSGFLSEMYSITEAYETLFGSCENLEDMAAERDSMVGDLESLKDECESSLEAMPEHLQDTSMSGELLTERIEGLESWISELENVELNEPDEEESGEWTEEDNQAYVDSKAEELYATDPGLS